MKVRSLAALAALCCFASPVFAQQLSRVQVLALQQQLRDDGCGIQHTTGHLDAMTRKAVEKCKSKYNVTSGGASALLQAMNIGFGANDMAPSEGAGGGKMERHHARRGGNMKAMRTAGDSTMGNVMSAVVSTDSAAKSGMKKMKHKAGAMKGSMKAMKDSANAMKDSTMGNPKN